MTDKNHILNAAAKVFYEQGATKAKFGDIAKQAGISRPTLYAAFEDKNAIMIATIYHVSEQLLEVIKSQLTEKVTAADRLFLFTEIAIVEPYKLIQKSEDAADILSGHNEDGKRAIRETLELRSIFLKEILTPFLNNDVSETEFLDRCRTFVLSGSGLKNTVSDDKELRTCLSLLSDWFLRYFKI